MHEARLHVDTEQHAEPDEVDPECFRRAGEQRNDNEGKLEEIEKESEQEDNGIDDDQKTELPARHCHQEVLDPLVTVDAVEGEREDARADQDEDDEGGELRGRIERLPQDAEAQPAARRRQRQRSDGSHRAAFGWRSNPLKDSS
jgi:hypothetical protein